MNQDSISGRPVELPDVEHVSIHSPRRTGRQACHGGSCSGAQERLPGGSSTGDAQTGLLFAGIRISKLVYR